MRHRVLWTGQSTCHDATGRCVPCDGSGQDAALQLGLSWPHPRFCVDGLVVLDRLTNLTWLRNANPAEFPFTWHEALGLIERMNDGCHAGFRDWRLPNCQELRSLVSYQSRRPALPWEHPFEHVFPTWYWTNTTTAFDQDYAWYLNMDGGRMFFGHKQQSYLLWPVRGPGTPATSIDPCGPDPRFVVQGGGATDRSTGLVWLTLSATERTCAWQEALDQARALRDRREGGFTDWRLPNINELASLIDYHRARPALPQGCPFDDVPEAVWTSTTSMYEPDWAWALYLHKGACGVGQKGFPHYHAWFVRGTPYGSEADAAVRTRSPVEPINPNEPPQRIEPARRQRRPADR